MSTAAEITSDEDLAVAVALLQAKQASMTPFAINRAERIESEIPGRSRWSKTITRTVEDETNELVAHYGDSILVGSEQYLRELDPVGLDGRTLHLVSFDTLGASTDAMGGFTMAGGVFDVLRQFLPTDATPGSVIALNTRAELRDATASLPAPAK